MLSLVHRTVDHSAGHSNIFALYKQASDSKGGSQEKYGMCLFCPEIVSASQVRILTVLYMVNTAVVPLCGMSEYWKENNFWKEDYHEWTFQFLTDVLGYTTVERVFHFSNVGRFDHEAKIGSKCENVFWNCCSNCSNTSNVLSICFIFLSNVCIIAWLSAV